MEATNKKNHANPFHSLFKRANTLDQSKEQIVDVEDECEMFGREVVRGCRELTDKYERELVFRKIRDVLFQARFPQPQQSNSNAS